jgi:hypothetical protein
MYAMGARAPAMPMDAKTLQIVKNIKTCRRKSRKKVDKKGGYVAEFPSQCAQSSRVVWYGERRYSEGGKGV